MRSYHPAEQARIQEEIERDRKARREAFDAAVAVLRDKVTQVCWGGAAVAGDEAERPCAKPSSLAEPSEEEAREGEVTTEANDDVGGFEKAIWALLMIVGLRAVQWYLASRRRAPSRRRLLGADGNVYKYAREKAYELRSIFGEGTYHASCYERGQKRKKMLCELDGRVGLLPCGGLSPVLALEVVELSTRMAYEQAQEVMRLFRPYVPSKRSICGIIDVVGQHAEGVLEGVTTEPGEVAAIQVDARGAPRIRAAEYAKRCKPHKKTGKRRGPQRRRRVGVRNRKSNKRTTTRRTRGQKPNLKKRVTVGLIYGLHRVADGSWEGGYGKFIARFGSAEEVFRRLKITLDSMGDTVKKVLFLSDGDREYRRLQRTYFPQAIAVVDFYHVCEYLWKAGETRFKEGSKELKDFVSSLKNKLLNGSAEDVVAILRRELACIPKRGPGTKGRRKRMSSAINYIDKRLDVMPYKELRELNLEIGSGAIEGAVRQIVALRLDGPGMRWGERRPQLLLHMVCLRLSGAWDAFTDAVARWAHQAHPRDRITPIGIAEAKRQKQHARKASSHQAENDNDSHQIADKAA